MIEFLLTAVSNLIVWAFGLTVFAAVGVIFLLMLDDGWKSFQRYLRLRALRKHREMYFHNPKFEYMQDYAKADVEMTMKMYDTLPYDGHVWKSKDD